MAVPSSSPARPAGSAARFRLRARARERRSCCTAASCASWKRCTKRSWRRSCPSRRSYRSISRTPEASDFANVASALDAQLGRLDALVHTAALLGSLGPLEHQSFDNWVALLRVNVAAPMGLTRIVMPLLARSPNASVVFTLDSRGQDPRAYWGGYAVTKAAIGALARELADEWEHRPALRVNAVIPGPIRSPLRNQSHPGEDPTLLPAPESLVPLYHHLIAGQTKADSDALIDAQAWLAGSPCLASLRP
jgi:NAD(P)-dependent dehydrogenase (short-subunit alcohol dehydrogenase family)